MARLGASRAAHRVEPRIPAAARGDDAPRPGVAAPPLSPRAEVRACPLPGTSVTVRRPDDLATQTRTAGLAGVAPAARRAEPGFAAGAHATALLRLTAHGRDPIARTRARTAPDGGEALRLRTVRRARVPWPELGRERLATAWGRVQTEHGAAGELHLVGVFGPVPIEALQSAALDADGRLAMTFSRRGLLGRRGDVALARVVATGRLVRSDIAHPPIG